MHPNSYGNPDRRPHFPNSHVPGYRCFRTSGLMIRKEERRVSLCGSLLGIRNPKPYVLLGNST